MADLLPNDSTYFITEKPAKEQILISREKGETLESYPLIEKVIEWLEVQATEAEKLTNLNLESKVPVEAQIISLSETAKLLRAKKGDLEALVAYHVKNRKK